MASAKILVNGESGSGKTTLLHDLDPKTTLVISRDSKGFSLKLPHALITDWYGMSSFLYGEEIEVEGEVTYNKGVLDYIEAFKDKVGDYPETIVFDTVSQITMDVINEAVKTPNVYGSQGAEINKELGMFTDFLHNELELNDINIIMLNHVVKDNSDDTSVEYQMFGQGQFKNKGGFYSIVDESITLIPEGSYLTVRTSGKKYQARTTVEKFPQKMYVAANGNAYKDKKLKDDEQYYSLKEHLDILVSNHNEVEEEFRL
jgi:hypothetical protein